MKIGQLEVGSTPNINNSSVSVKLMIENEAITTDFTSDQIETLITYLKGARDAMGWNKRYSG